MRLSSSSSVKLEDADVLHDERPDGLHPDFGLVLGLVVVIEAAFLLTHLVLHVPVDGFRQAFRVEEGVAVVRDDQRVLHR